jgi:hypothetical protein
MTFIMLKVHGFRWIKNLEYIAGVVRRGFLIPSEVLRVKESKTLVSFE